MSAGAPSTLARIMLETREEVARRKRDAPLESMARDGSPGPRLPPGEASGAVGGGEAAPADGLFRTALASPGVGVIAEFKRRSPSAGALRDIADLDQIVGAYERGGAVAVSVLTEGPNFGGSLEDLRRARAACRLPILRKDFIVDPYQLHEARAAGAAAVLLIVAGLRSSELAQLHSEARAMGLDTLVEVHDRAELHAALELGADTIGINNRDLRDFSVDVERTAQLIGEIPDGAVVISESGITDAGQVARLGALGVDGVLVGEALMRSAEPEKALRALQSP